MKKLIFILVFAAASLTVALANNPEGTWRGSADIMGTPMRIVFDITETPEGYLSAMQSPDQSEAWIPMERTEVSERTIAIELPMIDFYYTGEFTANDKIEGAFTQNGFTFELDLMKDSE